MPGFRIFSIVQVELRGFRRAFGLYGSRAQAAELQFRAPDVGFRAWGEEGVPKQGGLRVVLHGRSSSLEAGLTLSGLGALNPKA